ncbi:MAG TPA: hypothetical protein VFO38_01355, partial [Candidatus Saccharimonadales bacterium]|nr:hypothetical protein [Candidatus Saccharimonadales bacterium]
RIREAEARALALLEKHRKEFDAIVAALLEEETISGNRLRELAGLNPLAEEAHEDELTTVS